MCGLVLAGIVAYSSGTSIKVKPDDAKATAKVQLVDGIGLSVSNVIYALLGEPVVAVSADGFRSERRKLAATEMGGNITVTLDELPGHLIVKTVPVADTTRWTINSQRVPAAATLDREVMAGKYGLEIDNSYFEVEKRVIEVARAEQKDVTVLLKPVAGRLILNSDPSGSTVFLDGANVGETPTTLNVNGGSYRVEMRSGGYHPTTEHLEITNTKREVARNYRLKRLTATLRFALEPRGGKLIMNGRKIDPSKPQLVNANVENTITYMLDGHFPKSRSVIVSPAETETVSIRLEPEIGIIDVQSSPSASVFIDGAQVGETPIVINLPAKSYSVELRKTGYRSIERKIMPSSKHKTVIQENLMTELAARLSEAPKKYENAVGGVMVLFKPTGFVMGAPRNEKGQRANEFLRAIKLTKPFYAGKHEVTNAQFKKFKQVHSGAVDDKIPVTSVGWLDAAAFCNWLSKQENREPFYVLKNGQLQASAGTADGYRLLSEAEWEWLARRASRRAQTMFPWGDNPVVPPMVGNIADESARGTVPIYVPNYTDGYSNAAPVGSFAPEPSELFDLAGNVSEWVHDYYSLMPPPPNTIEVDPLGPTYGDSHIVKGASWRSGTRTTLRAAYREGLLDQRDDVGFRIARYLYGGSDIAKNE